MKAKKTALLAGTGLMVMALLSARAADRAATPETLRAEIDSLKAEKVAWREIGWKSCLLEGLKESRQRNKPALLWVFIDRPVDDARC
jgi:hypothetical protein